MVRSSLPIVQVIHRTGKILSALVLALSIVFLLLNITFLMLFIFHVDTISIPFLDSGDGSDKAVLFLRASAIVASAGEIIISRECVLYFREELEKGTPFDRNIAAKMKRLGIVTMAVSSSSFLVMTVLHAVMERIYGHLGDTSPSFPGGPFTIGLMFLILSLVCRYGAEVKEKGEDKI